MNAIISNEGLNVRVADTPVSYSYEPYAGGTVKSITKPIPEPKPPFIMDPPGLVYDGTFYYWVLVGGYNTSSFYGTPVVIAQ